VTPLDCAGAAVAGAAVAGAAVAGAAVAGAAVAGAAVAGAAVAGAAVAGAAVGFDAHDTSIATAMIIEKTNIIFFIFILLFLLIWVWQILNLQFTIEQNLFHCLGISNNSASFSLYIACS